VLHGALPPHVRLRDDVDDLLALETRLRALVRAELATHARDGPTETADLLRRLEPRASARERALEASLERMHARLPSRRRAFATALGRDAPAPDGRLDDVHHLLSACAAAYRVLATSARAAGDQRVLALARQGARDVDGFLREIAQRSGRHAPGWQGR
jgi:hypothetical protein